MKRTSGEVLALLTAVIVLAMVSVPVSAHHGTAAFDTTKMVKVKGAVTDFQFVNPHVQVYFECKNEKGEAQQWQGELTAPNKLIRAGWDKHTLKPGDSITVGGYAAMSGAHTIWIRELIGPSGEALPLFEE
jgi:Family of unknown function (DUF6152)